MTAENRPGQGGPENQNQNDAQRIEQLKRADQEMLGLQGRLLLADQETDKYKPLKADNNITTITEIHNFEQRTTNKGYDSFEKSSYIDRDAYWQQQIALGNVKDAQQQPTRDGNIIIEQWVNTMEQLMNSQGNKQTIQALKEVLKETGIQKENNFTKDDIKQLYAHYFESEKTEKRDGIKLFVKDVLTAYQLMGDNIATDKQAALDNIYRNINHIEWMANIFGQKNSVDMIKNLILAEAKNIVNTNELKSQLQQTTRNTANEEVLRINNLSKDEREILTHVTELPANKYEDTIKYYLEHNDTLIAIAGTGAGKSTQITKMIREFRKTPKRDGQPHGKFWVTQPRQLNATTLAQYVAKESGIAVGQEIGYSHGGGSKYDEDNKVTDTLFVTEKMLILKLLENPDIPELEYVMVDEVHSRTKDSEQLLYLLREVQKRRREGVMHEGRRLPELKIIAASATVNQEELEEYLTDHTKKPSTIEIAGYAYPVKEHFDTEDIDVRDVDKMSKKIAQRLYEVCERFKDKKGDIIAFVAGRTELDKALEAIKTHPELKEKYFNELEIIEITSKTSEEDKKRTTAVLPAGKKRRFIIGTNAMETGVTFEEAIDVINPAEEKEATVDAQTGLEFVRKIKQSKANAKQRKGRVGRTAEGDCEILCKSESYEQRDAYPEPELKRTDLSDFVLTMKAHGVKDLNTVRVLTKLDTPEDKRRIAIAIETLKAIGALSNDDRTEITEVGKHIAELPLDVHLGRIIAESIKNKKGIWQACLIAALGEAETIFFDTEENKEKIAATKETYKDPDSDLLTYLNIFNAYSRATNKYEWSRANGINQKALDDVRTKVRQKLVPKAKSLAGIPLDQREPSVPPEELRIYIYEGFKDRVIQYDEAGKVYRWNRDPQLQIKIDQKSILSRSDAQATERPKLLIFGSNGNSEIRRDKPLYFSNCQVVQQAA